MCAMDDGDGVPEHVGRDGGVVSVQSQHLSHAPQPLTAGGEREREADSLVTRPVRRQPSGGAVRGWEELNKAATHKLSRNDTIL